MNSRPGQLQANRLSQQRVSIYQPEQDGRIFPGIPEFRSHEEHRHYLKQRLVAACRAFALFNLDYGFAGHLTVRDQIGRAHV